MATTAAPPDWTAWNTHFRHSRERPLPDVEPGLDALPPSWRPVMAASLARFQRGETGEGRIAHEVRSVTWEAIDDVYADTLALFVAEEGRHARILGRMVRALGGHPAPDAWTGRIFELGRRALDARFELVALLGAEVAAIAAYAAIADRLPPCELQAALRQIVQDEHQHLAFHATLFRAVADTPARRALFVASLSAVIVVATGVLLADHHALWRTLGVPRSDLLARLRDAHALALAMTDPRYVPATARAVMAA